MNSGDHCAESPTPSMKFTKSRKSWKPSSWNVWGWSPGIRVSYGMLLRATAVGECTLIHERYGCMLQIRIRSRIIHTRWMYQMRAVLRPLFAGSCQSIKCKLMWSSLIWLLRMLSTPHCGRCRRYCSSFALMLSDTPMPG